MTMQNSPHPDDERLAAYAGGDSDALADSSLGAHLTSCGRCRPMVDELSLLRGALAELPDLAPSRPLRLIPPVAASAAPRSWLRRLTGPAMAAGAGLVLVGAVGIGASGGMGDLFGAASAGAPQEQASASDNRLGPAVGEDSPAPVPGDATGYQRSDEPRSEVSSPSPSPKAIAPSPTATAPSPTATADDTDGTEQIANSSTEQPWLTLLIAGAGLFGISAALRVSLSPRAG
jgi:hypothetical protein